MTAWEMVGAIIAFAQLVIAFLVAASLPKVSKAGAGAAATIYLIVAFASVIWITRSAMWQQ
jgi:hypothetical protein